MNKSQALDIASRAPVGWDSYSFARDRFYRVIQGYTYGFVDGEWHLWPEPLRSTRISMVTRGKVLEVANLNSH
jgi:hypothetical protein